MNITPTDVKAYEISARRYLASYGIEDNIPFDHFGLQTLSSREYNDLKNYFIERGKFDGEIVYHNRRLGKFRLGETEDKMELIEPHPGEVFLQLDCFVEHVCFCVDEQLNDFHKCFEDRILSNFSVEEDKGFKIQGPSQLQIEIRSNKL